MSKTMNWLDDFGAFVPAGLQPLFDSRVSRRSFLGTLIAAPAFNYAAVAADKRDEYTDLRFSWSENQTVLTVDYVWTTFGGLTMERPSPKLPRCFVKEAGGTDTIVARWLLPKVAFGPDPEFALRVTQDGCGYVLEVSGVAYGRNRNGKLTFIFERSNEWTILVESTIWASQDKPGSELRFPVFSLGKNIGPPRPDGKTVPIQLLPFMLGKSRLEQIVRAARVDNTFIGIFDGLVHCVGSFARVALDRNLLWIVEPIRSRIECLDRQVGLVSFSFTRCRAGAGSSLKFAGPAAGSDSPPDPAEERTSRAMVVGTGQAGIPPEMVLGDSAADNILLTHQEKEKGERFSQLFACRPEKLSDGLETTTEVFVSGQWDIDYRRGKNVVCGRLSDVVGSLKNHLVPAPSTSTAKHAQQEIISFSGRLKQKAIAIATPAGGLIIDDVPSADVSGTGIGDAARDRMPLLFEVGQGKVSRFDLVAVLLESQAAVADAGLSRLRFKPTEIRILAGAAVGQTKPASFVLLDDAVKLPADSERARIDLSHASLTVARAVDLVALKFTFADLALSFRANNAPEIVPRSASCRLQVPGLVDGVQNSRSANLASPIDNRPILVVEFPPQHVMEEAFFIPNSPPLPDVMLKSDQLLGQVEEGGTTLWKPVDKPSENPALLTIHPNSAIDVEFALAKAGSSKARMELRNAIQLEKTKVEQAASPGDLEFGTFATTFGKAANEKRLPTDQQIYIGPFALDPDGRAIARDILRSNGIKTNEKLVNNLIAAAIGQSDIIRNNQANPGSETQPLPASTAQPTSSSKDLGAMLAEEGLLESAVPNYQLLRNFHRDLLTDLILTGESELLPKGLKVELPSSLESKHIELFCDNMRLSGKPTPEQSRFAQVKQAYLEYVSGAEKLSEYARARLSRPSRLAFRVNCSDGRRIYPGQENEEPKGSIPYTIDGLTNWSTHDLSVVKRSQKLFDYVFDDLADGSGSRRLNVNQGAMLDYLGFRHGVHVKAEERLADIQTSLSPPTAWETAIEIPSRLVLSTAQDAKWQTPRANRQLGSVPRDDALASERTVRQLLWSADLMETGEIAGLRAVHSPDLASGFVWRRGQRKDAKAFQERSDNDTNPQVFQLPGSAAPPRGPIAPWLIGREESSDPLPNAQEVARAALTQLNSNGQREDGAEYERFRTLEPDKFGEEVRKDPRGWFAGTKLPRLVKYLAGRNNDIHNYKSARRFRTSLDAYDRHELVLLSSAYGLPVIGRRDAAYNLKSNAAQFEPDEDYQLADVQPGSAIYVPKALEVTELSLTALGGSLRHDTDFEPPAAAKHIVHGDSLFDALSIESWQQWIVLGRDVFTEVVYKGFLFPLGHRASLVKVTERTFLKGPAGIKAYLRQRMYLRCSNPVKGFPAIAQPNGGRQWPINEVKILTTRTPDIVDPYSLQSQNKDQLFLSPTGRLEIIGRPGLVFWPRTAMLDGAEVRFDIECDGAKSRCPLIFVDNVAANDTESLELLVQYYNNTRPAGTPGHGVAVSSPDISKVGEEAIAYNPASHLRSLNFGGQNIRYCEEIEQGQASFETELLTLKAQGKGRRPHEVKTERESNIGWEGETNDFDFDPILQGADQPPFYPAIETARVFLRQAERLIGNKLGARRVQFDGYHVANTFQRRGTKDELDTHNPLEIYLSIIDRVDMKMGQNGNQSGGIVRPDHVLVAVSRHRGIVGGDRTPQPGKVAKAGTLINIASEYGGYEAASPMSSAGLQPANGSGSIPPKPPAAEGPNKSLEKKIASFKKFMSAETKLLGLVSLSKLLEMLGDELDDPHSGLPKLVETIRYGASQADKGTEFIIKNVLVPFRALVIGLREKWKKLQTDLAKRQADVVNMVSDVGGTFKEMTLATIYPEVDAGLIELQVAISAAIDSDDPLALASGLGEVYETGRRFAHALGRAASDSTARFESAVKQQLSSSFKDLRNTVDEFLNGFKELADDFGTSDEISGIIVEWVVPGDESLPGVSPTFETELAQLGVMLAGIKNDDPNKAGRTQAINAAITELGKAAQNLRPPATQVRDVIKTIVKEIADGKPANVDASILVLVKLSLTHLEKNGDGAVDLAKPTNTETDPLRSSAADTILAYRQDLEVLATIEPAKLKDVAKNYLILAFGDRLQLAIDVQGDVNDLRNAVKGNDLSTSATVAIRLVERFTGPIELDVGTEAVDGPLAELVTHLAELTNVLGKAGNESSIVCGVEIPSGGVATLQLPEAPNSTACSYIGTLSRIATAAQTQYNDAIQKLGDTDEEKAKLAPLAKIGTELGGLATSLDGSYRRIAQSAFNLRKAADSLPKVPPAGAAVKESLMQFFVQRNRVEAYIESLDGFVRTLLGELKFLVELPGKHAGLAGAAGATSLLVMVSNQVEKSKLQEAQNIVSKLDKDASKRLANAGYQLCDMLSKILGSESEGFINWIGVAEQQLAVLLSESNQAELGPIQDTLRILFGLRQDLTSTANDITSLQAQLGGFAQKEDKDVGLKKLGEFTVNGRTVLQLLTQNNGPLIDLPVKLNAAQTAAFEALKSLAKATTSDAGNAALAALDPAVQKAMRASGIAAIYGRDAGAPAVPEDKENTALGLRNLAYGKLGSSAFLDPVRKSLLVQPDGSRTFADGVPPANGDLTIVNDQLALDTASLVLLAKENAQPISNAANRQFLKAFVREWGSKDSAILRIVDQLADLAKQLVRGDLQHLLDLSAVKEQVEAYVKELVPVRAKLDYTFGTRLSSNVKNATGGIFVPADGSRLDIRSEIEIDLSEAAKPPRFTATGTIGPFDIALVGSAYEALTLKFNGATFKMDGGKDPKFDISYSDYVIGKELEFIQDLQSFMSPKEGSGAYLKLLSGNPGVEAGYSLNLGTISIGTAAFFNVSLNTAAVLPFGDGAARFRASLSRRDSPFTISVAPYGGSGFFAIEADAKGIVGFEAAFEYGGAGAFAYGPLQGQGRLMLGVYVRRMKLESGSITEITATFFAGGSASIWIFNFASSLYVRMGMVNGNMTGEAVFTFSFSVGLADFDFAVRVAREEKKGFQKSAAIEQRGATRFANLQPVTLVASADNNGILYTDATPMVVSETTCQGENWGKFRRYFSTAEPILEEL